MGPSRCDFRLKKVPIISFHLLAVAFPLKRQRSVLARVSRGVLDSSQGVESYLKCQCVIMEVTSHLNPKTLCR